MARALPTRGEILRGFADDPRGLHVAEISARLGLKPAARKGLRSALEQLVLEGVLVALPGQRYRRAAAIASDDASWVGVVSSHPRGFAFVNAAEHEDVYIAPLALHGALHGDVVRVAVLSRSPRGLEGQVEEILERRAARIVGVLCRRGRSVWLEPDDARLRGPVVLPNGAGDAPDGAAALVRLTRFPESVSENLEGEVVQVFGAAGTAQTEVAKILAREGISEQHTEQARAEALVVARDLRDCPLGERRDLRAVPLLTIDPEDARDHDDSVFVEQTASGFRVYVAIADVSEFVRPGGALDEEAKSRGFTTYLPDRAVPMLPGELASDLCSLLPGRDRYSLCAIVDLDDRAAVKRLRLVEAVVRVKALVTYRDVACVLGFVADTPKKADTIEHLEELRLIDHVARLRRQERLSRGALDLDLPEPRVKLEPGTGEPTGVVRRTQEPGVARAYQMVEEMMLLANERVARWLGTKRSPAVYRVHAPPDPERLEPLAKIAKRLGVGFEVEDFSEPRELGAWLRSVAKHPLRQVLENLVLRSLKMAQYDTTNVGHFGLAAEEYLHFTSPIRRYPDLLVHRLVKALLRGESPLRSPEALQSLSESATKASQQERLVMQVEREVVDVYRCLLMRDRVGELFEGRVTSFVGSGLYVALDDPFVDVLVRFESLGLDRYDLGADGMSVTGARSGERIALGDRLWVEIEEVALWRRAILGRRARIARSEPSNSDAIGSTDSVPWDAPEQPPASAHPPGPRAWRPSGLRVALRGGKAVRLGAKGRSRDGKRGAPSPRGGSPNGSTRRSGAESSSSALPRLSRKATRSERPKAGRGRKRR